MNRNLQDCKLEQNHILKSCGLSLEALAGSGVTEEEMTIAKSGPDEAVTAGGVMTRLIHGSGPFTGCCWGLLHPHCRHFRSYKSTQT